MTITANRPVAPFGAITVFRLVNAVEALALAAGRAWRAAQTRRALARLSAHQLADVGVTGRLTGAAGAPGDIDALAQTLAARRS